MIKRLQTIFKHTFQKLMRQGPAFDDDTDSCAYRTPDGYKCAVGIWIPDDKYSTAMEGNVTPQHLVQDEILPELTIGQGQDAVEFWNALQVAHDDAAVSYLPFKDAFRRNMTRLAKNWDLQMVEDA